MNDYSWPSGRWISGCKITVDVVVNVMRSALPCVRASKDDENSAC